ncbi:hypothetical protein DM02DRAFT_538687 [Periconia macrospinosa]|uniref:F-box domain-containing protein n=1 Tax=Periconia macrospinosa TaxID=97972 RepID=A0A2V1D9T3_9PLEO|nr:hypothetical protein DM02DRAFT_538687 [Periconia macrospinosa]
MKAEAASPPQPQPQPRQHKRKEVDPEPEEPELPAAASPKRPRHNTNTNTRCRFLELPRELRDEIYKQVIWSDQRSVTLKQRDLITKSGLVGTNNQISDEFLDAVFFYSRFINTTVRNHNFAHVVTFINRLSEAQLERFKSSSSSNNDDSQQQQQQHKMSRKIRITLTYSNTKQSTRPQLNRWLDRFDDPNRRGAEIEFEYVLDHASWRCGGYKQRPRFRATAGDRSEDETAKMLRAMRNPNYGWGG